MPMAYRIVELTSNWEKNHGEALVQFLSNFENEKRPKSFWQQRLKHWWDENPYHGSDDPKGWILYFNDAIVGFLGVISCEYYLNDVIHKALSTTTWRVEENHRNEAMNLYFNLISLQQKYIILNTTPSSKVKEILHKLKYKSNNICNNYIFPITRKRAGLVSFPWNLFTNFCSGLLPDKDLNLVSLDKEFDFSFSQNGNLLSRNTSKEYLRWYCNSPAMPKKFLGLTDSNNILQAYVVVIKKEFNGTPTWRVIDYQSINHSIGLIYVLIRKIMKNPESLGKEAVNFLVFSNFDGKKEVTKPLFIPNKKIETTHYFTQPDFLSDAEKRCVKAEGDYGL